MWNEIKKREWDFEPTEIGSCNAIGITKLVKSNKLFFNFVVQGNVKSAQAWDIRSLGFSWFLHQKVFMGRWFGGKNIILLF
jgi:hypothetical protein